jgi:PAS domain S-box-containing protein
MEDAYRRYFDALPCYVTVQDRDLRLIDANQRFREDFGEIEGRHCYQVYKRRSEKCEVCPVERAFRDGQIHRSEERVTALDGRNVAVLVEASPIRNGDGEIVAVMEMSTDVTEIKDLQALPPPVRRGALLHLDPGSGPQHRRLQPRVPGGLRQLPGPKVLLGLQAPHRTVRAVPRPGHAPGR